jgi:hypothetical protein
MSEQDDRARIAAMIERYGRAVYEHDDAEDPTDALLALVRSRTVAYAQKEVSRLVSELGGNPAPGDALDRAVSCAMSVRLNMDKYDPDYDSTPEAMEKGMLLSALSHLLLYAEQRGIDVQRMTDELIHTNGFRENLPDGIRNVIQMMRDHHIQAAALRRDDGPPQA